MPSTPIEKTTMRSITSSRQRSLPRDHLSRGPDGGPQLWRAAFGALYRGLHVLAPRPALSFFRYVLKDPASKKDVLFANVRIMIETHAEMTSFLTPAAVYTWHHDRPVHCDRLYQSYGGMLLHVGEWHIIALILMAYMFGWLVGAGLPPTATILSLR